MIWRRVGPETAKSRSGLMYATDGASIIGQACQVGDHGRRRRAMCYSIIIGNEVVDYAYSLKTAKQRAEKRLATTAKVED